LPARGAGAYIESMDTARRQPAPLIDAFGRRITYLRLSVTDRCDLRCVYCMKERPDFLPKSEVLSLEELQTVCEAFIARGVKKIRITGGEPLVRRDVMQLIERLGARLGEDGFEELSVTSNATQLSRFAEPLHAAGVRRVNISLDTLDRARFHRLTRRDMLDQTLAGIEAAAAAGLKLKINAVALKDENEAELPDLIAWAHERGHDVSLIEIMPMGEVEADRADQFLPLTAVRDRLEARWTLEDLPDQTGGPSRYVRIAETGGRVGFISPLTNNFCAGCNRVRVTCTGQLYGCLGRDASRDLRAALREGGPEALSAALDAAIAEKPERHEFHIARDASSGAARDMARTGG
jgi:cyclic pyranopterin phosphate synthase